MTYPQDEAVITANPEPMRWINENIERLARNVEDVEKGFDAIVNRLEPILAPSTPYALESDVAEKRPISMIATRLDDLANRLASLAGRQANLHGRIEV